jgi:hypothetical protein
VVAMVDGQKRETFYRAMFGEIYIETFGPPANSYPDDLGENVLRGSFFFNLAAPNEQSPNSNPSQQRLPVKPKDPECDAILAWIFGGPGARATTDVDVRGTDRSNHLYLNGTFHIYGNENGAQSPMAGLYVPKEAVFSEIRYNKETPPTSMAMHFSYSQSGKNYWLLIAHVKSPGVVKNSKNSAGSTFIGFPGGLGGEGNSSAQGNYAHSHIEVSTKQDGPKVNPRSVFCNASWRQKYKAAQSGKR